jgi:hypothetical protein
MKKIFLSIATCALLFAVACDTPASKETEKETTDSAEEGKAADEEGSYENMNTVNLSEYDVFGSVKIPDESQGKPEIKTTAAGSTVVKVGNKYAIEIIPFGMSLQEKKDELNDDLVYEVNYLEEKADYIIYEKTIADSEVEPEVHFYLIKDLNGEIYGIQNVNKQAFSEKAIRDMLHSAKSLQAEA